MDGQTDGRGATLNAAPQWFTLLVGSHAAPTLFGTVFPHLYALLTASLVLDLSSRLICSQDICSWSAVRASDTLTGSFARYKFVAYLLT